MGVIRNKLLIGATFDEDSATAWFSNFGYHDVANSLAAVHTALLKAVNPSVIFKVYNHPLEANYNDDVRQFYKRLLYWCMNIYQLMCHLNGFILKLIAE